MLIGALADATGVPAKTLRYWEAEGLLHEPKRTDGGYRDYPDDTAGRVSFIRHAQTAGLTLRQISEIPTVRDGGEAPCTHATVLVDERLADIERRLRELQETRDALLQLSQRLEAVVPADCDPTSICSARFESRRPLHTVARERPSRSDARSPASPPMLQTSCRADLWGNHMVRVFAVLLLIATLGAPAAAAPRDQVVRVATFNASLNRFTEGGLLADLSTPGDAQAQAIAEIVQRTRPDILLVNEFDFDPEGEAARLFQEHYLSVGQQGAAPIVYPYRFVAPSNTGIPSGFDLDNNGSIGGPNDAFGFGFFPGQFGMAVYSRFPIVADEVRTFQRFLWRDMPNALLPDDPATPAPADWYSPAELEVVRLSSKSHWDIPITVGANAVVHFLVSHPTPPVFDGPEDRNGRRNFDEIRFWADYVHPARDGYIYDDEGARGGLKPGALFVIAGDQNADPVDGDSFPGAIQQLLEHPLVNTTVTPASAGAVEAAALQGGANESHDGDPAFDTADFRDSAPGNLRVDYVLPRKNLRITDSSVFWPVSSDPLSRLTGTFPFPSSDHRLVWLDVRVPGA